jgi:endonuclease III
MVEDKIRKIIFLLDKHYPEYKTFLRHKSSWELLVSTILSAQCTDKRVNLITKGLFKKYEKIEDYANANLRELEMDVKSTGFFRNKAKNIKNSAKMILSEFNGEVPDEMDELVKLHGVGRKTANIVLSNFFGIAEGIAVDTHVKRISFRLGLTDSKNPTIIEKDLMNILPKKEWIKINHRLVTHGREVCKALVPKCSKCFLKELCLRKGVKKSS